ncbi:DNA polymerase III subunit [Alkaliphilus serpentinus]|uniref:DNA polymerase III subunit delta' n=1 Tax=Alkaliphilus serpentinus TaxID=1482731 RepID=A0A833MAB5_9FIRM|nr:DNA polymerase III subunit delta' C-terminal domain-containing protein [Alkaliphilus serpentinus]KAB3531810.1 DNA polymerase III subunit delta' [Alkaliphilus serpentinus]
MELTFRGIIGQKKIIDHIKRALSEEEISHAYLIEGAVGLGRRRVAKQLAMAITCMNNIEKPCHSCSSCLKAVSQNHPEIKIIEGDGSIKIDLIREIQKEIQLKPYEGKRKVIILYDCETMTLQAQNAFLKTLEEPPLYATIIMITVNSGSLLPTIVSRCQLIKLNPVNERTIQEYLVSHEGASMETSKVIAAYSGGNIGNAVKMLYNQDFKQKREELVKITKELLRGSLTNVLELADFFTLEKREVIENLDLLMSWYRDLLIYRETQHLDFIRNYDKIEEIVLQSKNINTYKLQEVVYIIEDAKNKLKSNVNFQLNMEVMLLNIQEVLSW